MKKIKNAVFIFAAFSALFSFSVLMPVWNVDSAYSIKFDGSQASGTFSGLSGLIQYDPADLKGAKFDVLVDVSTIDTGNKTKNTHAKGEGWFDLENHPQIRFTSTSFTKVKDQMVVKGILEIRGIKKEVEIPYTYDQNGNKAVFKGVFLVDRNDYGIDGGMMGFMVGDDITINLQIPVSK